MFLLGRRTSSRGILPKISDMRSLVLHVVLFAISSILMCKAQVDKTLIAEESGPDVVRAVIGRIKESDIFPSDKQFLRRIAYVESKDGTDQGTYRAGYHGGIWQVDEIRFRDTQDIISHPGLIEKFDKIQIFFGIEWRQVQWEDLRKYGRLLWTKMPRWDRHPFLNPGLAARLKLSNIEDEIPLSSNLEAQGQYWKNYYDRHFSTLPLPAPEAEAGRGGNFSWLPLPAPEVGGGSIEKFVKDVEALMKLESKLFKFM